MIVKGKAGFSVLPITATIEHIHLQSRTVHDTNLSTNARSMAPVTLDVVRIMTLGNLN